MVDLKDAYFHIQITPHLRHFNRDDMEPLWQSGSQSRRFTGECPLPVILLTFGLQAQRVEICIPSSQNSAGAVGPAYMASQRRVNQLMVSQ